MRSNQRMIPALALVAAGILGAGVAVAQMPDSGAHPDGMRGFQRLHKQLNLNPQQEGLWQKAQGLQRDAFKSLQAKAAENRAKLRAEIDKPGADLKAFAQLRDQLREQTRTQMEASHEQTRA